MLLFNGPDILVPLGFFALVGYIVYLSVRRKEREAMIKKGLHPDHLDFNSPTDNKDAKEPIRKDPAVIKNVKSGLVLIGVGLGFFITKILIYNGIFDRTFSSYFSLVSLFGGIGLVGSYFFIEHLHKKDKASGEKGEVKKDRD